MFTQLLQVETHHTQCHVVELYSSSWIMNFETVRWYSCLISGEFVVCCQVRTSLHIIP